MGHEMLFIWAVRVGMLIIAIVMGICIWAINFPKRSKCSTGQDHEWEVLYINGYGDTLNRCKHCPAETWS